MKGILLAGIGTLAYLGVATLLLRRAAIQRRAAALLYLFLATLPVFVAVHLLTPPDLALLPVSLTEPVVWIDLALGLYLYAAGFFGGSLQLYNLAERGFSLRLLIDILESPMGAMTQGSLFRSYSRGRGILWMYQKRLEDLREQGLIQPDADMLRPTSRGQRVAALFARLRALIGLKLWA